MGAGGGSTAATGAATTGAATGAGAAGGGRFGGSISAVYSRTKRPRDQLNSTRILIKGSLTEREETIFT